MLLILSLAAYAQSLVTTGGCPGVVELEVGALAGDRVAVVLGSGPGRTDVPDSPCGPLGLDLDAVTGVHVLPATDGAVAVAPSVSGGLLSAWVQAVDLASCTVSRAVPLCPRDPALVGTFQVRDGPHWSSDPPTYSCLDACAVVFGGYAAEYACSTRDDLVDHLAYVDGYGDATYCTSPLPEQFKLHETYDCGFTGCSYSAYVSDHDCGSANVCYLR